MRDCSPYVPLRHVAPRSPACDRHSDGRAPGRTLRRGRGTTHRQSSNTVPSANAIEATGTLPAARERTARLAPTGLQQATNPPRTIPKKRSKPATNSALRATHGGQPCPPAHNCAILVGCCSPVPISSCANRRRSTRKPSQSFRPDGVLPQRHIPVLNSKARSGAQCRMVAQRTAAAGVILEVHGEVAV